MSRRKLELFPYEEGRKFFSQSFNESQNSYTLLTIIKYVNPSEFAKTVNDSTVCKNKFNRQ